MKIFNFFALKVVAVAYERWSLTRSSKFSDLTCEVWYFGNWSSRRGGRRFDVTSTTQIFYL